MSSSDKDINYSEDDAGANGIVYEITVETKNNKLNDGQRAVIREAMVMLLAEMSVKMQLIVQVPNAARVIGYINTTNDGRREMHVPEGINAEASEPAPEFTIGGVGLRD
jgi:hypothetical protein